MRGFFVTHPVFGHALAVVLALALSVAILGFWFLASGEDAGVDALAWSGNELTPLAGRLEAAPDGSVRGYGQGPESILVLRPDQQAVTLDGLEYAVAELGDLAPETEVLMTWRPKDSGDQPHLVSLDKRGLWPHHAWLGRKQNWRDEPGEVALAFRGVPKEGIVIRELALQPRGVLAGFKTLLSDWTHFGNQRERLNPYHIRDVSEDHAQIPQVPVVVLVLGLYLLAARILSGRPDVKRIGMGFLVAWVALDLYWQWDLVRANADTLTRFAPKTYEGRREAVPRTGRVYAFMQSANAAMPAEPQRVFFVADSTEHRLLGRYFLYPHNSLLGLRKPGKLEKGDFIVVFGDVDWRYDSNQGVLARANPHNRIHVQRILDTPQGAVYRVR